MKLVSEVSQKVFDGVSVFGSSMEWFGYLIMSISIFLSVKHHVKTSKTLTTTDKSSSAEKRLEKIEEEFMYMDKDLKQTQELAIFGIVMVLIGFIINMVRNYGLTVRQ